MTSKTKRTNRVLEFFSSYALAIGLLACLFLLTIVGTLYQKEYGLFAAKQRFFSSWFVWAEIGSIRIPTFPGGMICMGLLSINMLVGGLLRMRISQRNLGVVVIHVGIAFLLISGLVKQWTADEGNLLLAEGRSGEEFTSNHLWEVAVFEVTEADVVEEIVIRHNQFEDLGRDRIRRFTCEDLPFDLLLSQFIPSVEVETASGGRGGLELEGLRLTPRTPHREPGRNAAGLMAEVQGGGESQRTLLWGFQLAPWTFESGGKTWAVDLRRARYKMPFQLRLEDFQKEDHPGIGMARAFRSDVTKIDEQGEHQIRIQMNEPLRSDGLVFFQSSWGPQDASPAAPCTVDVAASRILMFGHTIREGRAVRIANEDGDWGTYEVNTVEGPVAVPISAGTTFYARDVTGDGFRLSLRPGGSSVPFLSAGSGHMLVEESYSVFSVVRNVSDKWPEYSMWVITVGLLMAFVRKLVGFVKAQGRRRANAQSSTQGGVA